MGWQYKGKHPVGKPATAEEQEVLFQAIIRKIPSVGNPAKLQEISVLALALMLRRPTDHDLRGELTHQVQAIIAAIKPCHSPEGQRNEMRLAARNCIKVLQTAKEKRLPRPAGDDWAQAKEGTAQHGSAQYGSGKPVRGKPGHPAHEKTEEEEERGPLLAIGALALVIVAIGGWVLFGRSSDEPSSDGTETERFVAQMVASAEGNPPPSHLFGGIIRVTSMNGVPVVIAEGVPPRYCSSSGMKLVKKGLLSVNGVTPTRVSSAIITELCNKESGNATLMWAPKR